MRSGISEPRGVRGRWHRPARVSSEASLNIYNKYSAIKYSAIKYSAIKYSANIYTDDSQCLYTALYIIILFGFLIFINMDDYKLRILFNYLNLHINGTNIFSHITLFILFILIIYYFIYSVDSNIKNRNTDQLTEEEKIDYKYKLDIITLIIF